MKSYRRIARTMAREAGREVGREVRADLRAILRKNPLRPSAVRANEGVYAFPLERKTRIGKLKGNVDKGQGWGAISRSGNSEVGCKWLA
jgi:hypothetical protein